MKGFVFEGGSARGSYQVGAAKAYIENGFDFGGCTGTSIGAINAALIAQGELQLLEEMWLKTETSVLFDIDDETVRNLMEFNLEKLDYANIFAILTKTIKEKGADTSKIKKLLSELIDEDKLRKSGKDFGLVTVSLPDFRPFELMLEDIPNRKLIDYIMASSCFPGFKAVQIGTKIFTDGGLYDNLPLNLLAARGYDEIVAVRTLAPGIIRKLEDTDVKVTTVIPSDKIGPLFVFSPESAKNNIKLGYFDALRIIKELGGKRYYVESPSEAEALTRLCGLDERVISATAKMLDIREDAGMRLLFEKILPVFSERMKLKRKNYSELIINIFEYAAEQRGLERFKEYSFEEFKAAVKDAITANPLTADEPDKLLKAATILIAAF